MQDLKLILRIFRNDYIKLLLSTLSVIYLIPFILIVTRDYVPDVARFAFYGIQHLQPIIAVFIALAGINVIAKRTVRELRSIHNDK